MQLWQRFDGVCGVGVAGEGHPIILCKPKPEALSAHREDTTTRSSREAPEAFSGASFLPPWCVHVRFWSMVRSFRDHRHRYVSEDLLRAGEGAYPSFHLKSLTRSGVGMEG